MKHLTRRMKKAAPLALLGLFLVDQSPVNPTAQALVGGPFDDNAYFGSASADGTYSGTLTGKNLIGIVSFGVSSTSEGQGRFSVFHEGFVSYGAASGIADLASRRVAASLLGVAAIPGESTSGSGAITGGTGTLTVRSAAEGSFIARMKGYPQQVTFEGEGELATSANTAVLTTATGDSTVPTVDSSFSVTFDVPGSAGTDAASQGTSGSVTVEGTAQTAILRTSTPFKVRGSRTSRTPYSATNSFTGVAPLTLDAATPSP